MFLFVAFKVQFMCISSWIVTDKITLSNRYQNLIKMSQHLEDNRGEYFKM